VTEKRFPETCYGTWDFRNERSVKSINFKSHRSIPSRHDALGLAGQVVKLLLPNEDATRMRLRRCLSPDPSQELEESGLLEPKIRTPIIHSS
jgi:hypothetical protein